MSEWYARQFGDREQFAVSVSLGRDVHPSGRGHVDATWGGFSLWVRGQCLTRNLSDDSGLLEEVRWNLYTLLEWLVENCLRVTNEEPLPMPLPNGRIPDAAAWATESLNPPATLSAQEEKHWFAVRSDWLGAHALRRAALDVALPNVTFRRFGDKLEVSWDNHDWGTPRPGLRFVERRGCELVDARGAGNDIAAMVADVTKALSERSHHDELVSLALRAGSLKAQDTDWTLLIHHDTATIIERELPSLGSRIQRHVASLKEGVFVPHSIETLALREARLKTAGEIEALLRAIEPGEGKTLSRELMQLASMGPAAATRPWDAGYDLALRVREQVGWGILPIPDLATWLAENGVLIRHTALAPEISAVAVRNGERQATAAINCASRSRLRKETGVAAAFGHILMDTNAVAVEGEWEHWPTAARARAFGAMLLMPDGGLKKILAGKQRIDADDVRCVMSEFSTAPYATTFHLKNRGFIDEERRAAILAELTQ